MSEVPSSDALQEKLRGWLESSGRALELRVARTLQRVGEAVVRPSIHYVDTVTGTPRESDVVAHFRWSGPQGTPCSITMAVECKSGTKYPWVAFYTDDSATHVPSLKEWAIIAHGPFNGVIAPIEKLWRGHSPFVPNPVATHVVSAMGKDDHNPAGDAVRQVLSCTSALKQEYLNTQSTSPRGVVLLAAVVTSAPLFKCRLAGDGSIQLEPTDSFDVWGYDTDGVRHRVFIESESSLHGFAIALRDRVHDAGLASN
ncbi:hypothetical protein [Geodermatophilus normandii]|uniref:Uncharacterized protein n=1 Tax=Geodermatophilus normandii TaxID=1137989 RepID=A0A6P0GBP1_9ACTN|nr:hypothetical protein [Geodermatophilus normandii]NEM05174.1 hypothetical protein [Geodermatophilus normandii]